MTAASSLPDVSVIDIRENGLKWVARLLEVAAFHLNGLFTKNTDALRNLFLAALAPAEGMARRILALRALEAGLPAPVASQQSMQGGARQSAPPDITKDFPPLFKLTEPLPGLFDAEESETKVAIATAGETTPSDPTLSFLKRFEALSDVLDNPGKHIARMARQLARTQNKDEPVQLDTYMPPGLFDEGVEHETRTDVYRCNAALVEALDTS